MSSTKGAVVDENYQTSNPKIYSGGDIAGMKGTVAWAAVSGREAAKKIAKKIAEKIKNIEKFV